MISRSKLLLDTDILSLYLSKQPRVVTEAQEYLRQHEVFTLSLITPFEILRGMKAKNADGQLGFFDLFCSSNEIIDLDDILSSGPRIFTRTYIKREKLLEMRTF